MPRGWIRAKNTRRAPRATNAAAILPRGGIAHARTGLDVVVRGLDDGRMVVLRIAGYVLFVDFVAAPIVSIWFLSFRQVTGWKTNR